jgi:SAM-dependent methyltransferase
MATYDAGFYDTIRPGTQASAAVIVPWLLDRLSLDEPHVVDVGCGEGWWAQTFADHGCDVVGIDGAYVQSSPLGDRFVAHDLRHPIPAAWRGEFDLAVSLEVAEHLPSHRAVSFVDDLCALAPIVVFSAAIPGQGGTGHINEQWPAYWAAMFNSLGYEVTGELRYRIWDDDRVENWYRQNLLVAWDPNVSNCPLVPGPALPLVHPVLYDARRQR